MPQVGSNAKPIMIKGKKTGKILGDTGSWYTKENKKKYEDNYDDYIACKYKFILRVIHSNCENSS